MYTGTYGVTFGAPLGLHSIWAKNIGMYYVPSSDCQNGKSLERCSIF